MCPTDRRCAPPEGGLRLTAGRVGAAFLAALAALGVPSLSAQENLGFEDVDLVTAAPSAWSAIGPRSSGVDVASDERQPKEGRRSLRLTLAPGSSARIVQRTPAGELRGPAAATGRRVRLSGYVRVAPGAAVTPALWLRVDGPKGPLFLDSQGAAAEELEAGTGPAESAASDDWRHLALELPWPADISEVAFGISARGSGNVWFDGLALEGVAVPREVPAASAAVRYLDEALVLMREHALYGSAADWPGLRVAALAHLGGARSALDAHLAVRFALRELGDRHSYLQGPAVVRALRTTAVANALTRQPPAAPAGRRLAGELAYLAVPGFAGGTHAQQIEFAESIKNIIQELDSPKSCGWIVDLRDNRGGNLWPMLVGLGPLLGEGDLAASVYPDGRRVAVSYRDGKAAFGDYVQLRVAEPYRLRAPVPVAVLVGPGTASSAEVLVVAFRGREAARSFGAPTSGVSAGNRIFPLADGASLVLTVAATSDRFGLVHAGAIEPDERVGRGERDDDAVLTAALAWLGSAAGCH